MTDIGPKTQDMQVLGTLFQSQFSLALNNLPHGDQADPKTDTRDGSEFLFAFTNDQAFADYFAQDVASVRLAGRDLLVMIQGKKIGLIIDAGTDHGFDLEPDLLDWLAQTTTQTANEVEQNRIALFPANMVNPELVNGLGQALYQAKGFADRAYVATTESQDIVVGFAGAEAKNEGHLITLVNEFSKFFGDNLQALNVTFVEAGGPLDAALQKVGMVFDLTVELPDQQQVIPGSDPSKPPILK